MLRPEDSDGDDEGEGEMSHPMGSGPLADEQVYCTCKRISFGEMIACDNADCPFEWVCTTIVIDHGNHIDSRLCVLVSFIYRASALRSHPQWKNGIARDAVRAPRKTRTPTPHPTVPSRAAVDVAAVKVPVELNEVVGLSGNAVHLFLSSSSLRVHGMYCFYRNFFVYS